jgi:AbrB family looped-hinge helix DNA binding protein
MHDNVVLGSATVGSRGQVVLPKDIRKECDIKEGDTLIVMSKPGFGGRTMVLFKASSLAEVLEEMEATGRRIKAMVNAPKGRSGRKTGEGGR